MGRGDCAGTTVNGGGVHCSPSISLSLFIYDTSSMTGNTQWPQGQCSTHITLLTVSSKGRSYPELGLSGWSQDNSPLPITLRESAGLKFGWMRAITALHARLAHEGWIMVMFGSKGESRRFYALSVTMSVASIIWHHPSGKRVSCYVLLSGVVNDSPGASKADRLRDREKPTLTFHLLFVQCVL